MTAFISSIQNIAQSRNFGLSNVSLPEISMVEKAYEAVKKRLGEERAIKEMTLQDSERCISEARKISLNDTWDKTSTLDLKNIGKCLWYGEAPLASDDNFLKKFLNTCYDKMKKSLCRVLIDVYLRYYEPNKIGIALL